MLLKVAAKKLKAVVVESVGYKLAVPTFLILALVAAGGYVKLSRGQRESLLNAKEAAGSAVTRLFADSCAAPVIFEDAAAIRTALGTLGGNQEVEYGAVWSVDGSGRMTRQLGELSRGRPATPSEVPAAPRRERDRLVVTSPIRDENAKVIALAVVTFSLIREQQTIAATQILTLLASSGGALIVLFVLMALARVVIISPLGKLVVAARELENGGAGAVEVRTNDEVGKLARAFQSMASAIKVREARIGARNRDMLLVLDNVGQGFITLGIDGLMSAERSRVIDAWFGPAEGPMTFWEYLRRIDGSLADYFEVGWMALHEDVLPLSLCLDQLPSLAHKDGKTFELAYRPIMEGARLEKIVVVITDVTTRIARERAERGQREQMSLFRHVRSDRAALDQFFVEVSALVEAIVDWHDGDLSVLRRQIHTVKGNCALFGIESVAEHCHDLEQWVTDTREAISPAAKETLRGLWANITDTRAQFGDRDAGGHRVEIDGAEYAAFITELRGRGPADLVERALTWPYEPVAGRLVLIEDQIRTLAARLGRAAVEVVREPTELRLPPGKWAPFWSVFAHVVRNTVDHGVDTAEERVAAGKPIHARVEVGVRRERDQVVVSIADDGRGINWETIAARAQERGVAHTTRAQLEEALFVEGISSRESVTTTSGRGVGLHAVRQVIVELGGRIEIQTAAGKGTTFRFLLPASMLSDRPGSGGAREATAPVGNLATS